MECAFQSRDRGGILLLGIDAGQIDESDRVFRRQGQDPFKPGGRCNQIAAAGQQVAAPVQGSGVVGLQCEHCVVRGQRPVKVRQGSTHLPEAKVVVGLVRALFNGPLKTSGRVLVPMLHLQGSAQCVVKVGLFRREGDGAFKRGCGPLVFVQAGVGQP